MSECLFCRNAYKDVPSWFSVLLNKKREPVCERCLSQLKWVEGIRCQICSRQLMETNRFSNVCFDCYRWEQQSATRLLLKENHSLYHYNGFMKELLATYKYRGDAALATFFAPKLLTLYEKKFRGFQVMPIPLSQERLLERTFNQTELLLQDWPQDCICLHLKRKNREKQSKKSRQNRIRSFLDNPFYLDTNIFLDEKLNKIVLVDDIYTTGTTLRQAAKTLKQAGVEQVVSLTIAR
ncbi:ComF family protein [Alkalihalobacillus sp. 1P02AB]|uniref:ComF family protein n=1 Tax=Alkalihalobacillus sp. 1P02AB TaxID=3132260 RepID=UPI0039A64DE5